MLVDSETETDSGVIGGQAEVFVLNVGIHTFSWVEFLKPEVDVREESLIRVSMGAWKEAGLLCGCFLVGFSLNLLFGLLLITLGLDEVWQPLIILNQLI